MSSLITWKNDNNFISELLSIYKRINNRKAVIIALEPYGSTLSLFYKAKLLNYSVIALTANNDSRKLTTSLLNIMDIVIVIDTKKIGDLLELINKIKDILPIHAIIPGFEYFVAEAAILARYLSLPGLAVEAIANVRRKEKMRSLLFANNILVPKFALIYSVDELDKLKYHLSFPMVCKPYDAAGSVLVKKVVSDSELLCAVKMIIDHQYVLWGHPLAHGVLVEEYIEGAEYSVEGIVQAGEVFIYSITEKLVSDQYDFVEIGHQVHAPISQALSQKIRQYCAEVVLCLGMDHTPFHLELRLNHHDEPVLMEVAARLAGDKIADLIGISSSVDYLEQVLAVYLGKAIVPPGVNNSYAGIRFFYRPMLNSFCHIINEYIHDDNNLELHELEFYYAPLVMIPSFPKALRRLGHAIMSGDDYSLIKDSLAQLDRKIKFT